MSTLFFLPLEFEHCQEHYSYVDNNDFIKILSILVFVFIFDKTTGFVSKNVQLSEL